MFFSYQLCKNLGVFPFSVNHGFNSGLFYFITAPYLIAQAALFTSSFILIYFPTFLYRRGYCPYQASHVLETVFVVLTVLVHPWVIFRNRNSFEKLLTTLPPNKLHFRASILLLTTWGPCIFLICGYIHEKRGFWQWIDMFIFNLVSFTTSTILALFVNFTEDLELRFSGLELSFSKMPIHEHANLIQVSRLLMELFGKQLSLMVMMTTCSVVGLTYQAFLRLLTLHDEIMMSVSLGVLISGLMRIFIVVHVCERAKYKAQAFNNELFKLMRENDYLSKDNKLFLYVTMKQTVNFTACGFFNLGYPLVTSIIAAATTYLVILLQLSMP